MKTNNEIINEIKSRWKEILNPDKSGKGGVCLLCGNGTGNTGDGVLEIPHKNHSLKCFKCDFSGDIIAMVKDYLHCDFKGAVRYCADKLGINSPLSINHTFSSNKIDIETPETDFTDFINSAHNHLLDTDYWKRRGLSIETCNHFNIGFVEKWKHPITIEKEKRGEIKKAPFTPRLIIPTSDFSYLARDTRQNLNELQKKHSKSKVGKVHLFNTAALKDEVVFVVEGEINAMSLYEVGASAVALGSTSNVNKLTQLLQDSPAKPEIIIVLLDNDEAGQKASNKLLSALQQLNIFAINFQIDSNFNDVNDWLIANPEHLKQFISDKIVEAKDLFKNWSPFNNNTVDEISDDAVDEVSLAINTLNNIDTFTPDKVLTNEVLDAAALCRLEAVGVYESFRTSCKTNKISMATLNESVNLRYKKLLKKPKVIPIRPDVPAVPADLPSLPDFVNINIEDFTIPSGFNVYNGSMYTTDKDGNSIKFCNSVILVVKEVVNIDEGIYKTQLACCKHGRKWIIPPAVDDSTIASAQKIVSLSDFGIDINSNNAKAMVAYIDAFKAANADVIPQVESVNKCGWRDDETFITPYNQNNYIVDTSKNSFAANALTQKGDISLWLDTLKEVRKHTLARFITSASFATPLLNILDERSFSIYVNADSKAGKTATMKFGGSVWGNPDEIAKNFNCTLNGLEVSAAMRSDFPLIINEKQLAESQNKRNKLDMTKLLYLIGEGEGKSRMDKNANERKSYRWRTICLANGETNIISDETTQGAITRTLIFNADGKILPDELSRQVYRVMKRNYGLAGKIFIDNLMKEDFDKLRDQYDGINDCLRKIFNKHIDDHVRFVSLIAMGDFFANNYLYHIDEATAFKDAMDFAADILRLLKDKNDLSDVQREIDFFTEWMVENMVNFIGTRANDEAKSVKIYGDDTDPDYRYVIVKPLKEAAEKAGFNYQKLIRDFAKAGYTVTNNDGRHTVKHRMGGDNPRCLKIPKNILAGTNEGTAGTKQRLAGTK